MDASPDEAWANPVFRRAFRVLAMVGELHKRGHQRLRIMPGMAPSGMYWRCTIFPADPPDTTSVGAPSDVLVARYTTGMENRFFDWTDAQTATARQLATLFVERFPALAQRSRGDDWPYAGWYVRMLGIAERGHLPIAYDDGYPDISELPHWPTTGRAGPGATPTVVPRPPPVSPAAGPRA